MDPLLLLPELLLFLGGLAVLVLGSFTPRHRQWTGRLVAAGVLVAAIVAAAFTLADPPLTAFADTAAIDVATRVVRMLAPAATLLVVILAGEELSASVRESETYSLLLFATAGTLLLAAADDLLVLSVGFLLASIPLYALVGLGAGSRAPEAAMKTYLLGAIFGILLLLGIALLYGLAGSSLYSDLSTALATAPLPAVIVGVVAVLAGLMFKAGAVPAHFWVPDAAQGAGAAVAAFITTVPKIGAAVAVYRLVAVLPPSGDWVVVVGGFAALSMLLGNLAAYFQQDPRRLLGWSTVGQVGFILMPAAVASPAGAGLSSLLYYLGGYAFTNVAAFAVAAAMPARRSLSDFRGLARSHPWLTASLLVAMLGLVGTPPVAVFVGKVTVGAAAWEGGAWWLTLILVVTSVISLFYYLRWLIPAFQAATGDEPSGPPRRSSSGVAVAAAAISIALGIGAGAVWPLLGGALAG